MDALLMCGGRGTRLDAPVEKPVFEVGGRPMVDRVADALAGSRVATTHAVVSPHAPETGEHVREGLDLPTVETPGADYVADLETATDVVPPPVLVVAADLPLLAGEHVDAVIDAHRDACGGSVVACVPAALKRRLGVSLDRTWERGGRELVPAGLNVVADGPDAVHPSDDPRLAVNVNRRADAGVAERLLAAEGTP